MADCFEWQHRITMEPNEKITTNYDESNIKWHWFGIDRLWYEKPKSKINKGIIQVFLYTGISWIRNHKLF